MTPARAVVAVTVLGAAAISACNLLTGAADLEIAGDGASSEGGSSGGDGARDTSTGRDGPDPPDADVDADSGPPRPPCTGSNGRRGVCMPASDGWMPVAVPRFAPFGCQSEYPISTSTTGVDNVFGACSCSCEPASGSCAGDVRVEFGGTTCSPGAKVFAAGPAGSGCIVGGLAGIDGGAKIVPIPATPPTGCAPRTQNPTSPAPLTICSGAVLSDSQDCASGHSCVPPVGTPLSRNCVAKDGDVPCPAGFGLRIPTGTSPVDTRSCSGCACGTDCSDSTLKVYKTSNCSSTSTTIRTTCSASGFGADASSAEYQPGGGCNVTKQGTVSGTITFSTPRTVCCP